jgi:hypothetical protein
MISDNWIKVPLSQRTEKSDKKCGVSRELPVEVEFDLKIG